MELDMGIFCFIVFFLILVFNVIFHTIFSILCGPQTSLNQSREVKSKADQWPLNMMAVPCSGLKTTKSSST